MNKRNFEFLIAREGLILIGIAVILYFLTSLMSQNIRIIYPKYRAEFANGKAYIVEIYPEIDYSKVFNPKAFLKEVHDPEEKLISRRIEEFRKKAGISGPLKDARCANSVQLYFFKAYSAFLSLPLLVKVFFAYLFLALLRFILWALKTLKR